MAITLQINGQNKYFAKEQAPATLLELINQMNINQATVVAEIDGQIIKRGSFATTTVSPGQDINLIRFVSGG